MTLFTPTAKSTAFYYLGNFAVSSGRYFFHILLLRLLLPSEYGEFLAYLSLLYILGIPSSTVNSVVVKFVSDFRGKNDHRSINEFFYHLIGKLTPLSLFLGVILIIFSTRLSIALKAHPAAFIILGASLFISIVSTVVKGYLLAFQRLTIQIVIGFIEIICTLGLAYVFITLGLSATGAVLAQIVAGIIGVIISFQIIKKEVLPPILKSKRSFSLRSFTGYSLIYAVGSVSLLSTDVLLARYFLTEHLSGIYSSLAVIGRTIYFGLGPLIVLVLPVASHRYSLSGSSKSVFIKLGGVILLFGLLATGIFVSFPNFIISFVSGANYQEAARYLPIFAFSMLLFSINLFLINYFMAIGKQKANLYLLAATIAQPVLITIFHQNLTQIVWSNVLVESLLLASLLWRVQKTKL